MDNPSPKFDNLLNERQVARMLNVCCGTVARWRHLGRGPRHVRLNGRSVRYQRLDVLAFIAANLRRNTGGAAEVQP